jgi:hypothetical protein
MLTCSSAVLAAGCPGSAASAIIDCTCSAAAPRGESVPEPNDEPRTPTIIMTLNGDRSGALNVWRGGKGERVGGGRESARARDRKGMRFTFRHVRVRLRGATVNACWYATAPTGAPVGACA